ncbi:hypothetical protein KUCAC02_015132 [Chaenocephalus aceratus]|uniref:Uncharacterized protein n=1 Tax=Chaenocephalus aceratus TaxID=36190 RepID=A0ACB9XWL6_CHAAC|nr:hypothetical protein KUCAC02_015132 [Chaenocephalus aceratus]
MLGRGKSRKASDSFLRKNWTLCRVQHRVTLADVNLLHVVSGCKPYPISLWGGTMAPRDALPDARGPPSFPRSSSHTQPPLLIPPSVQSNDCPLHAPYHPILRFSSAAVASYG